MKKTLPVLLLIPFVVAILTYVSISPIRNMIAVDITAIDWDYLDNEGFRIDETSVLEATPVYDTNFTLADGNDLVWETLDAGVASITSNGDVYSITGISEGETTITCRNEKGSVSRSFTATVFETGAIVIVDQGTPSSGDSFVSTRTYGQYDYSSTGTIERASVELGFRIYSEFDDDSVLFSTSSSNLSYENGRLYVNAPGASYATFVLEKMPYISATYSFAVEEGAVNVKSYDDLMHATNLSETGRKICLQRNLLSLQSTYRTNGNGDYVDEYLNANTRLFGRYDFSTRTTSFDIHEFETTYPHDYLRQYAEANPNDVSYEEISAVRTGIHVQQSIIGNGFTISCHELCYTYHGGYQNNGRWAPSMDGQTDFFEGPLPYVFLGPYTLQVITAYGQDNSAMYVDGDNITISDLKIRAVDNVDDLNLLEYVGSTVDVLGENVTIKDSYLRNGRTCLRVYSSPNFLLDNCYLNNAREFLMKVGSNEVSRPDGTTRVSATYNGLGGSDQLSSFLASGGGGDDILSSVTGSLNNVDSFMTAVNAIQDGLDSASPEEAWAMEIRDTFFETSGFFSLALESVFNGPFLYSGIPSFVGELLSMVGSLLNMNAVLPTEIGGVSRPVNVRLTGDVRFYDYKSVDSIDASCLIYEQLSEVLASIMQGEEYEFPIDSYFPIKALLEEEAARIGSLYNVEGEDSGGRLLGAIAFYGGGDNRSRVDYSGMDVNPFSREIEIDYARACFSGRGLAEGNQFSSYLARCVPLAAGSNSFSFYLGQDYRSVDNPYLLGEVADVSILRNRGGN